MLKKQSKYGKRFTKKKVNKRKEKEKGDEKREGKEKTRPREKATHLCISRIGVENVTEKLARHCYSSNNEAMNVI